MIEPRRLIEVDNLRGVTGAPLHSFVDRERGVCVQVWDDTTGCSGTPWEGTLRVAVKHTSARSPEQVARRGYALPITWDDMQAIKDHFWSDRIAIEVYPPREKIVDVADMRWMCVLPKGAVLPFNLQSTSRDRLES